MTHVVDALRSSWRWLGHRLRLSPVGRLLLTAVLVLGTVAFVDARAHGDREGGAPLVVLALLSACVVVLDAVGRGIVALVRHRIRHERPRRGA